MSENKLNWNAHEFNVYLLLFAANADLELTKEENQIILSKAKKTEFQHIHKIFEKNTDMERLETILSFREQFFPTENHAEKLIKEIFTLLSVDGKLSPNEENFFRIFKKILKF